MILLTSPRIDHFKHDGQQSEQESGVRPYLPYQLDVRPSQEFNHSDAKNKMVELEISTRHEDRFKFLVPHNELVDTDQLDTENMEFTLQEGRHLHMASYLDLENKVTLGCAGAILTYLQRRGSSGMVAGGTASELYQVTSVEMSTLSGTMFVNARTLKSLQIIESEYHPKGLSVYRLFQRFACTPQGKKRLQQIFLRSSFQLVVIHERQFSISVYLQPDNYNPMNKMVKALRHIKNLRPVIINLRKGISTGSGKISGFKTTVWATFLAALRALEEAQLYRLGRMIQDVVDFDSSDEQGRTVVRLLKQVAIEIAITIPASFHIDVNVIYFPQLGFNIAIPLTNAGEAAYTGSDDGWELIFITENRAYFKDFRMREMDEKLGDIFGLVCEKEIEIVYDLAQRVLQYENVLIEASDVCGEIDSLLAMAQAVASYNLHMLQEMTVSSYVPNDTFLVGGKLDEQTANHSQHVPEALRTGSSPSMLLSEFLREERVYMKQNLEVALIVYLAQTGSFVPAESAEIGVVDKILVKSNSQDGFSQQISFDLKHLTGRSLLLIDEFGKRTSENDGIGLACEVLEHLLSLEDAPKVIAATHFHEILENEFLQIRPRLQGHREVRVCGESREADDQITYLYNFRIGRSTKSFGTICAAMNGINQAIVGCANELASLSARGENLIAACAMLSDEEMQALQDAGELARRFLAMDLSKGCESGNVRRLLKAVFEDSMREAENISLDSGSEV
ncbi:muts domain V-domain-containing protein [Aspergillus spectabilis]